MSTYMDQDNDAREEALSESEDPGQVLDPLADPIGSRGTQRTVGSEYEEEDARERPPEDGLDPEIPEDENLHVSSSQDIAAELDDAQTLPDNSAGSSEATGEARE
jgi:hypothetical protein